MIGKVTDERGQPVAGAFVRDHYSGNVIQLWMRASLTGKDGCYEIGSYSLESKLWSMGVSHPDFADQSKGSLSAPTEGNPLIVNFVLDKGFEVEGDVFDPDGKPVRGAKAGYTLDDCYVLYQSAQTDAKGHFRN